MRLLKAALAILLVLTVTAAYYTSSSKTPEPCGHTSNIYANCVHYRYSELAPYLTIISVYFALALILSFVIKGKKYLLITLAVGLLLSGVAASYVAIGQNHHETTPPFPECYTNPNGVGMICE